MVVQCPDCAKRQAQEKRDLSDCESRCQEMQAKNQRLTLALTVLATLLGKESLDFALGLSSTIEQIAQAEEVESMQGDVAYVPSPQPSKTEIRHSNQDFASTANTVLFPELPALLPMHWDNTAMFQQQEATFASFFQEDFMFIPETGLGVLFISTLALTPSRKRKDD